MFDLDIVLKIAVNALKSAYLHNLRFSPHFKIDCEDFFSQGEHLIVMIFAVLVVCNEYNKRI